MSKIVLIDWGIISHTAIYSRQSAISTYIALTMLFGALKKIGLNKCDIVIIACDGRGNWRKDFSKDYKGDREKKKEATGIDFKAEYQKMNELLENLEISTPFHIIKLPTIEADDIMAVASKNFKEYEKILVSYDKDLLQLLVYDNVKIFSNHPTLKNYPYKILHSNREKEKQKAYGLLNKKIYKEESDNLKSENITESEDENRELIVNLLDLPDFIVKPIEKELKIAVNSYKEFDIDYLWYPKLIKRYHESFSKTNVITYEKCLNRIKKKENKRRRINNESKSSKRKSG